MQVWIVDEQGFWVDDGEKQQDELSELDITVQPLKENGSGFYKAKWNFDLQKWFEGATTEEIEEIKRKEEDNQQTTPDKNEIRLAQIEDAIGTLATQVAKNTLLQGGI